MEEAGEEGVVLVCLSLSGACGNAASPKCTVGLNLKFALLFFLLFCPFLSFLFHQGLNGFWCFLGVMSG